MIMRKYDILWVALAALSLSFSSCTKDEPFGSPWLDPEENPWAEEEDETTPEPESTFVDMGIRVVSSVAADGTVTTVAIGYADDRDFMLNHLNAQPLYFATGNLIVHRNGTARLGAPDEITAATLSNYYGADDEERDLFGWADTTGWKTSRDLDDYPSQLPPEGISGNPDYDIARAKLGDGWRLPTAEELSFLMEKVARNTTTSLPWQENHSSSGSHTNWQPSRFGITLTSTVGGFMSRSIFIPAVGSRVGVGAERATYGIYWSGTRHAADTSYGLSFNSNGWNVRGHIRLNGFTVRPVKDAIL